VPGENVVSQGNLMIDAEAQMAQPESLGVAAASDVAVRHADEASVARWEKMSKAAAALAADDLAAFNQLDVAGADSLAAARRAFHEAVLPVLESALQHPGQVKVYECPMTSGAFPGAPPQARWIQMEGPLRNPWFGAAMLDCGTEVRP